MTFRVLDCRSLKAAECAREESTGEAPSIAVTPTTRTQPVDSHSESEFEEPGIAQNAFNFVRGAVVTFPANTLLFIPNAINGATNYIYDVTAVPLAHAAGLEVDRSPFYANFELVPRSEAERLGEKVALTASIFVPIVKWITALRAPKATVAAISTIEQTLMPFQQRALGAAARDQSLMPGVANASPQVALRARDQTLMPMHMAAASSTDEVMRLGDQVLARAKALTAAPPPATASAIADAQQQIAAVDDAITSAMETIATKLEVPASADGATHLALGSLQARLYAASIELKALNAKLPTTTAAVP